MKTKKNLFHQFPAAALTALAVAISSPLQAATFTWTGATSDSWVPNTGNWSPDPAVFGASADLVFNTIPNPNMFLGFGRTVRSISFGPDIDSDVSVSFQTTAGGTTGANLTFDTDVVAGDATITVANGSAGNITLGNGLGGTTLNPILADNLVVDHNGSGLLLFNRPFQAAAFGITKNGTGTMQTNNNNLLTGNLTINAGTFVANTSTTTGDDLDNFSAVNLAGGTLQIGANFGVAKTYNLVPLNVISPSTLEYRNTSSSTFTASFTTTGMVLNSDLAVKNVSTTTTNVNGLNLSRAITGSGDMAITTYNDIASSSDNFGIGRILLTGDNSAWLGDLTVARGTVSLGGTAVNAAGTGVITIGTTADAFGAGVTFFPQGGAGSTVTYPNNITVASGGFRAIKGGGTDHRVTFQGDVTLNGDLTLDHTWGATDRRIGLTGKISGNGGLTITRAGGNAGTTALLSGTNTYLGATTVSTGASLAISSTGSLTSNITVQSGARLGGGGSTSGNLTLEAGANFFFFYSLSYTPFSVAGTATLDNSFGIASLVGGSQGEAVPWAAIPDGTYTLIASTASTFNGISNFGLANAITDIAGSGKTVYFQNGGGSGGGGLQLVITTDGGGNVPPTISDIANQSVPSGGNTGALAFTITDEDVNTVTPSGSSSNLTLVPNANIVFGGSGANRTVTVTPVSGLSGSATITVTLTDNGSLTANDTFVLTVTDNYLSWSTANGVTGGPNGDSNNNGVPNLIEYALADGGERGVFSGGDTITFTKRGAPYGNDVTYDIESSTLLTTGSWSILGKPPVIENSGSISYTFTLGSPVKNFARLKVVQVP